VPSEKEIEQLSHYHLTIYLITLVHELYANKKKEDEKQERNIKQSAETMQNCK
jgi:hypothetical protein